MIQCVRHQRGEHTLKLYFSIEFENIFMAPLATIDPIDPL